MRGVRIVPSITREGGSGGPALSAGGSPGSRFDEPLEGGSPDHSQTPDLSTDQLLSGTHTTGEIVAAAALLEAAGWSEERIRREVYAPFIVVGPASWTDSWHAVRHGPGSIVREHEGQDVLCQSGTPVLAPEDGTIEFDTELLGGRSARLLLPGGGHYYFAHFIDWNDREFSNGDEVHPGDVIGFCGDTGNATVAHVHFGWYGSDGVAIDPMRRLIRWLREAEADLPALLSKAGLSGAGAAGMVGSAGPTLDMVRSLLEDRLAEWNVTGWRNASESGSRGPLDLTPVLFLVLVALTGRGTTSGSRRRRPIGAPTWPIRSGWEDRRGPLLS
ncbi:MAG: M23 family metallopeptidase [Actinomycetota bacterium]